MNKFKQRIEGILTNSKELLFSKEQLNSLSQLGEELKLEAAYMSVKLDPYWPKWNSPWWKVVFLYEAGFKQFIPRDFLQYLITVMDCHYLHQFPLTESEIPKDCDPYRDIMCFCALGSMYKVLEGCGFDVQAQLPWWFDWLGESKFPPALGLFIREGNVSVPLSLKWYAILNKLMEC